MNEGEEPEFILHDNQEAPHQLANFADDRPEVVAELTEETNAWGRRMGAPWA